MRIVRAVVVVLALAGAAAACGSDQDPGFEPSGGGGPSTTSHLLSSCPADGSTVTVDCLDPDGKVVHP